MQAAALGRAVTALAEVDNLMVTRMPATVAKVSASKSPALLALLIAAARWPDRTLATHFVHGFKLVGDIEASHIFRELPSNRVAEVPEELFGEPALEKLNELLSSRPSRDAQAIFDITCAEIDKNQAAPFRTAEDLTQ